jgi:SWI/SNF-related matrix-associated actin-dependent regulator of chromatin subfamily A member 5
VYTEVVETTGKLESEVKRYFKVFFERYVEISDHEKIIERIQKGEAKIDRILQISHTLKTKVDRHKNPWQAMTVVYGSNKGKAFTEEEDRFLICMMDKLGYGQWEQLKLEIRKAWQFRFDWFLKSRTTAEISRRCDTLVRLIEKENEDQANGGGAGGGKKKATAKRSRDSGAGGKKAKKGKGGKGGNGGNDAASPSAESASGAPTDMDQ